MFILKKKLHFFFISFILKEEVLSMKKKEISSFFKAMLTALAFTLNLETIYKKSFTTEQIFLTEWFTIFLLFFLLYQFYIHNNKIKNKGITILSLFFSFCLLFGYSYLKLNSWDLVFGNYCMVAISCFVFLGYFFLFQQLLSYVQTFLMKFEWPKVVSKKKNLFQRFLNYFEEHPIKVSFIVLILCWLIYMLAFYPVILSPDPSFQIRMYFNVHTKYIDWVIPRNDTIFMTTHHPVIHTFLLGTCIQIGRFLGSDNFGLFIYSILQTMTLAFTLSYTIYYTKKLKMKNGVRLFLLGFYALVPMFPFYAMSGVKDTYYTCFVILYTLFLLDLFLFHKKKRLSWKEFGFAFITILLMMLFRNNGIYIVLLSFPFLFLFSYLDRKRLVMLITLVFVCYFSFTKGIIPALGISDGSIREALSLPFQQTARYVKYHEDDLTEEEIQIIDKILGYKTLKDRYDPEFADTVKNKFNKYATSEDLKKYFGVWFHEFLKHPDTYIQATMNNTYGYFYPNASNWYIYSNFDDRITQNDLVDYHYNKLSGLRSILTGYGNIFPRIPGIGLVSNVGFNAWILFFLIYLLCYYKKKELLVCLLPALSSLLVCVASPVNTYFRYAMPYIFIMPFLLFVIVEIVKERKLLLNE